MMKRTRWLFFCLGILLIALQISCQSRGRMDYPISSVPMTSVELTDAFWAPRLETNRKVTIPFAKVKSKQLTTFTRQLSTLQDAGLPLLRSLQILEQLEH